MLWSLDILLARWNNPRIIRRKTLKDGTLKQEQKKIWEKFQEIQDNPKWFYIDLNSIIMDLLTNERSFVPEQAAAVNKTARAAKKDMYWRKKLYLKIFKETQTLLSDKKGVSIRLFGQGLLGAEKNKTRVVQALCKVLKTNILGDKTVEGMDFPISTIQNFFRISSKTITIPYIRLDNKQIEQLARLEKGSLTNIEVRGASRSKIQNWIEARNKTALRRSRSKTAKDYLSIRSLEKKDIKSLKSLHEASKFRSEPDKLQKRPNEQKEEKKGQAYDAHKAEIRGRNLMLQSGFLSYPSKDYNFLKKILCQEFIQTL